MSRARNIKPGFFKNELLVELPFEYRLLFIGLWTMADREGRFEDRPTKIRMELFPADSVDVNSGLQALHDNGFILRYEADGKRFCQVLAWSKHQNPHVKEGASSIPAPDKTGASPVQEPYEHGSRPADSSPLIPDTGFQGEREMHATEAGVLGSALRKAGCSSVAMSHPDFLAALAEGVTADEAADGVEVAKANSVSGAGMWLYAIRTARSNHAKTASVVALPSVRAGPSGSSLPPSRTQLASDNLEAAAHAIKQRSAGLDHRGTDPGLEEASFPQLGRSAGT